jgi:choline-sulfatase
MYDVRQLPLTCGCLQFGQDLPPNHMTFARRLAQAGYATVAAGKLHHMGTDQMQGWTQRIGSEMQISPWFIADQDKPLDEASMAKIMEFKWSDSKEIKRAGIGRGPCIAHDEYALTGALDFIDSYFNSPYYDRPRAHQPLLLKVSFLQPHYPYFTDEERFNYYLNRVDPYLDQQVSDHPFLSQHQVRPGEDASERELRRATAAYYGMVETIDDYYGQVLDRLSQVGQNLDDWIIIYTSDHGEMLGQHGIWEKQKFYEASARVPLIIRWPKGLGRGKQIEENVNLCDLFATLCDLCDISTPDGLDSRSLAPLLRGDSSDWDNETVSQFGHTNLMIKRDALKYQYYGPEMPEVLFDLKRDPEELVNFIDDPTYASADRPAQTLR